MIQLRWLERPTGKTIMDDHGYYQPETERVLQFRQEYNATIYAGSPSDDLKHQTRQMVWGAWTDVPVVTELEQA